MFQLNSTANNQTRFNRMCFFESLIWYLLPEDIPKKNKPSCSWNRAKKGPLKVNPCTIIARTIYKGCTESNASDVISW